MSESLEDVYKVSETWEQEQMGACNESTFYIKKENFIGWATWEKNILSGLLNTKIALNWN